MTFLQVAQAGVLASYLVVKSTLFPAYRQTPLSRSIQIGGRDDVTTSRLLPENERHIVSLQSAAHRRALELVAERRPAIEAIADEMCASGDMILGHRILEILEEHPVLDAAARSRLEVSLSPSAGRPSRQKSSTEVQPASITAILPTMREEAKRADTSLQTCTEQIVCELADRSSWGCSLCCGCWQERICQLCSHRPHCIRRSTQGRGSCCHIRPVRQRKERAGKLRPQQHLGKPGA